MPYRRLLLCSLLMSTLSAALPQMPLPGLRAQAATAQEKELDAAVSRFQALSSKFAAVLENLTTDPDQTVRVGVQLKQETLGVRKVFVKHRKFFPAQDYAMIMDILLFYDKAVDGAISTAQMLKDVHTMEARIAADSSISNLVGQLPLIESIERALRELAATWDSCAAQLESVAQKYPSAGFTSEHSAPYHQLGQTYRDLAATYHNLAADIRSKAPAGDLPSFRSFEPPPQTSPQSQALKPEAANLFKRFDTDHDGKISLGEGENFYYWVEKNVKYRYDDENEKDVTQGYTVGDGRPGNDFRQRPHETAKELQGDCEDMATLEASFYRSFGTQAYVICVNAADPEYLDHAIAIVKIGTTPEAYRKALGSLLSYEVKPGQKDVLGKPVEPGYYMAVDNAYSASYGYISGGIQPGRFRMKCLFPANDVYDQIWGKNLNSACGNFLSE